VHHSQPARRLSNAFRTGVNPIGAPRKFNRANRAHRRPGHQTAAKFGHCSARRHVWFGVNCADESFASVPGQQFVSAGPAHTECACGPKIFHEMSARCDSAPARIPGAPALTVTGPEENHASWNEPTATTQKFRAVFSKFQRHIPRLNALPHATTGRKKQNQVLEV